MAKSKLLARTSAKQAGSTNSGNEGSLAFVAAVDASASADVARPRTAGGEKSILQRLRIGRLFFGVGSGSSPGPVSGYASASVEGASAGIGLNSSSLQNSQCLFRTSSAHATESASDLLLLNHRGECSPKGDSQTIPYLSRQYTDSYMPHNSSNRKSRYSVHSRRLSAPDGAEITRRLSLVSLASELAPSSCSSSEYQPNISIVVSSTSASQRGEGLLHTTLRTRGSNEAAASVCQSTSLSTGPASNRYSQSDASRVDSFNTACSREAVAYQGSKNSASPLLSTHARNSSDGFIPIPSNAPTPIVTPATPHPSDESSTGVPSDMAAQLRPVAASRSPADSFRASLGVERCKGGDALLGVDSGDQRADNVARGELLAPNSSHGACSVSRIAPGLATLQPERVGRSQALGVSMEAHRPSLGFQGPLEHNMNEALSTHKQRWQQSPAFVSQSLSLPTSPATPSQRVSPLLQPRPNAPCCIESSSVDAGSPIILMGSVKQRGDRSIARQSGNVDSAKPSALPPQPTRVKPSSLGQPMDAPRPQAESPDPEPVAVSDGATVHASVDQAKPFAYINHMERAVPPNSRPKSLYEGGRLPSSLVMENELSPLRVSSSIASAKAFLTMIAADQARGSTSGSSGASALTVVTSDAKRSFTYGLPGSNVLSPALASAPVTGTAGRVGFTTLPAKSADTTGTQMPPDSRTLDAQDTASAAEGAERELSHSASPGTVGSRSLRARSRLASVGIRRASTYVWSRSSVFMRGLASTDELSSCQGFQPTEQATDAVATNAPIDVVQALTDFSSTDLRPLGSGSTETGPTSTEFDSATSSSLTIPMVPKSAPAVMRVHAARELVMTEKNFVDNLFVIKKVWMEPVFSSANSPKPIIPYQTARIIFFGIASLHSHASQFYREMDYILGSFERNQPTAEGDHDDGMRIGTLFRTSDRHWNDFIAYVRNYGTAVNCLKQLQDYKPYLRYHDECMAQKRTNRQSLKDLLMLPIQRITRYTLLLKNILKHTPAVHSDHIELCRAVKNVTHFASIVNECRRKQEEMYRLIEIFRTIELCPALPHSESRVFVTEFVVRELISRLPIRLLLFSDMIIVTQASAHTKLDDAGQVDAGVTEWTYHGLAFLDRVEVQNADESTNTLITILSLNRGATANDPQSACRRSLPSASEPIAAAAVSDASGAMCDSAGAVSHSTVSNTIDVAEPHARPNAGRHDSSSTLGPGINAHRQSGKTLSDIMPADLGSRRKKMRSRKGILRVNSRDSIPDHIAALSRSTFPSPVPSPALLERSVSRLNCPSYIAPDAAVVRDKDTHASPQHRPKTASGSSGTSFSSSSQLSSTLHASNATLAGYTNPMLADPGMPYRPLPPDAASGGSVNIVPPVPTQLTLVMQHANSAARKQFVRALKDVTATHVREQEASCAALDANSDFSAGDSGCDVLNLHPL